ncbi:MAG TPA: mandelate racemase/muconate lactonizing enzyme family protein [Burkholderiales bacterium]|nr:mandelate racemase/muconate lactonizing enzyme family protein [Burkholderiales bacterium]
MKVTRIETLRCDAGWRMFSFLKVMTDDGIVGWSEYNESFGSAGLSQVIEALSPIVIGRDPRDLELINCHIRTQTIQSRGGINRQAVAAIENALLDIKGKALGVPVYDLFGGAVRKRIPVYWSHCGSYRARYPELLGVPRVKNYDDLSRLAEEVKARGFKALKTNVALTDGKTLTAYRPGFGHNKGFPELNWDHDIVKAAVDTVSAFRAGGGPALGILLDLNFNYKTEGFRRIADAVAPVNLTWLEIDTHDAPSLALLRRDAPCPIASCEILCERRDFKPFFENYAMDVAIIDVIWNGYMESLKIASMAEVYEINVAPHNFYGHLSSVISAHFCAAVPNFRIMETDIDAVPWRDELVDYPPQIENGEFILPTRPGWGVNVNEAAVRAHPPK